MDWHSEHKDIADTHLKLFNDTLLQCLTLEIVIPDKSGSPFYQFRQISEGFIVISDLTILHKFLHYKLGIDDRHI